MPNNTGIRLRVVIDTNLWVSYLIGKTLASLTKLLEDNTVRLLFSDELFDELLEVLHRPKFKPYFSAGDIRELIELINLRADWIEVTEHADACRDPKDNFLLDLSSSGKADYLVTGDSDLLDLETWGGTEIVNHAQFAERIAAR